MTGKKHQNNNFHCAKLSFHYFWTCHFVKFEGTRSFKLCKFHLPKEIQWYQQGFFNACLCELIASNDWTIIYAEKLILTSPQNTHKHTHTHLQHTWIDLQPAFCFSFWEKVHLDKILSIKQNVEGGRWFKQNVGESGWQFSIQVKVQECRCHLSNAGDLTYLSQKHFVTMLHMLTIVILKPFYKHFPKLSNKKCLTFYSYT